MSAPMLRGILVALLLAGGAQAQRTGTLIGPSPAQPPDGVMSEQERARRTLALFAQCVVDTSLWRIERYLETAPGTPEARQWAVKLADERCLSSGQLRFAEPLIRMHVYQTLYRKQFREGGPADLSSVPPIDYGKASVGTVAPNEIALRQFGDCVARANPGDARKLVLSNPGSNAEGAAFEALMPAFSGCLPKDQSLQFSKSVLKGVVGETLYRLSQTAGTRVAAGSAD